jgi:pantoate--beta-alanine ligase
LQQAREAIVGGADVRTALESGKQTILAAGFSHVDYFELADAQTLAALDKRPDLPARLLAAAKIGRTRLIDNLALN